MAFPKLFKHTLHRAGERTQWLKVPAAKADKLSSNPWVDRENFPKLSSDLHITIVLYIPHLHDKCIYTNKFKINHIAAITLFYLYFSMHL